MPPAAPHRRRRVGRRQAAAGCRRRGLLWWPPLAGRLLVAAFPVAAPGLPPPPAVGPPPSMPKRLSSLVFPNSPSAKESAHQGRLAASRPTPKSVITLKIGGSQDLHNKVKSLLHQNTPLQMLLQRLSGPPKGTSTLRAGATAWSRAEAASGNFTESTQVKSGTSQNGTSANCQTFWR